MNWRCFIGRHGWDAFGRCDRCWRVSGISDTVEAWAPGASFRAYYGRIRRAGEDVQTQMRALGHEVSLELCEDAARHGWTPALLQLGRERSARGRYVR